MIGRRMPRRERAIIAAIRTGRIPGRNTTWSEFCDLVRAAALVRQTPEGFPRGWSNKSIMTSAIKISRGRAMLCERCKTEIALANALDAEPDVNRRSRELLAGVERRVLPGRAWALFEVLYAGRGQPVSRDFLRNAIGATRLGEYVRELRRAFAGSRYRLQTCRGIGYELIIAQR
jgi:hypothetical protein